MRGSNRNGAAQRVPNEVSYYTEQAEDSDSFNNARMDSHGGWVATQTEIAKFAISVDGLRPGSNILQSSSIASITCASGANPAYASGWAVDGEHYHAYR